MKQLIDRLKEKSIIENQILQNNKDAIDKRNLQILRLILISNISIFAVNFILTFCSDKVSSIGYLDLRWAYLIFIIVVSIVYIVLKVSSNINPITALYVVYSIGIAYCVFTSAFISSNYISVVILALLFQVPVLYVDKGSRITIFIILSAAIYLLGISQFKNELLFIDESINVVMFSATALVVGRFTRASLLENFAMKATLKDYAYTDQLTKLSNRRRLFEAFAHSEKPNSENIITGLAIIDIDNFKNYNDTYGHQVGDVCLCKIADCFLQYQSNDIQIYRYGGEEFLVTFYDYSQNQILESITNIRKDIERLNIIHTSSHLGVVTISIGAARFDDCNNKDYELLLSKADQALYLAKGDGKNTVKMYQGV